MDEKDLEIHNLRVCRLILRNLRNIMTVYTMNRNIKTNIAISDVDKVLLSKITSIAL